MIAAIYLEKYCRYITTTLYNILIINPILLKYYCLTSDSKYDKVMIKKVMIKILRTQKSYLKKELGNFQEISA